MIKKRTEINRKQIIEKNQLNYFLEKNKTDKSLARLFKKEEIKHKLFNIKIDCVTAIDSKIFKRY